MEILLKEFTLYTKKVDVNGSSLLKRKKKFFLETYLSRYHEIVEIIILQRIIFVEKKSS